MNEKRWDEGNTRRMDKKERKMDTIKERKIKKIIDQN